MSNTKARAELHALRAAALDDLLQMTDDELIAEAQESPQDVEQLASHTKALLREAAASTLRLRLKASAAVDAPRGRTVTSRPPLDQIKSMVRQLFEGNAKLGLAYRDGKKQTDADWLSLYDDLVAMGAIKPHDDQH